MGDVAVAHERSLVASSALPLLILVVALAAATVWFVVLPAFDEPRAERSCEVVVLKSGSTACRSPFTTTEHGPGRPAATSKTEARSDG